jgi:hypothetical protein
LIRLVIFTEAKRNKKVYKQISLVTQIINFVLFGVSKKANVELMIFNLGLKTKTDMLRTKYKKNLLIFFLITSANAYEIYNCKS